MAIVLNVDYWDWVHPETQKVIRLRRGDEVPAEVLSFTEDGGESMLQGPRPVLLKTEDPSEAGPKTVPASTSQGSDGPTTEPAPKTPDNKK